MVADASSQGISNPDTDLVFLEWYRLNKNVYISIKISLKFVPKGPINDIQALVQIMAWRQAIVWTIDG